MKKHKITVIKGTGVLRQEPDGEGGQRRVPGEEGGRDRHRLAGEGDPADRARDQQDHRHQLGRGAVPGAGARRRSPSSARARSGASSPTSSTRSARKVTLIEALPRILPLEDAESSDVLTKSYRKRGITVLAGAKVKKATVGKDKVTLEVEAGGKTETVEVEKVLMAAGRAVNTEAHGVPGGRRPARPSAGFVKVNLATLETTAPGRLLHRRRGRAADAGAQGQPGGRGRGRADRRAPARTRSSTTTSPASPTAIPRWPASG